MSTSKRNRVVVLAWVLAVVLAIHTSLMMALDPAQTADAPLAEGSEQLTAEELAQVLNLDIAKWHVRYPDVEGQCRVRVWVEQWRDGKKVQWEHLFAEQADRYPLEDQTRWSIGGQATEGKIILKLPSADSPFWYFAESGGSARMDCSDAKWAAPLINGEHGYRKEVQYELDRQLPEGESILLRCIVWGDPGQSRPVGSNLPDMANLQLLPEIVMADDRGQNLQYLPLVLAVKMQIVDVPLSEGMDGE